MSARPRTLPAPHTTLPVPHTVPTPARVMRSPRTLDIAVTGRCNLRCRYCYHFDNPQNAYTDLPTADWLAFFAELGRAGVMSVCLGGGEPFIREDLPELIDGVVAGHMRFSVISNGGLISDAAAAHIAATGRCDYVQVSVDGSRAEVHDTMRGQGSFAGARRGIETLRRHGVSVAVRLTIHRGNVHDLENTAPFLLDDLGLPGFGTNSAGHLGSCAQHGEQIELTVADREDAMRALVELAARYPGRIQAQAGPLAEARMWGAMDEARRAKDGGADGSDSAGAPRGGALVGCGCSNSNLAVRADGAYTPCTMLPHLVLGHIGRDDLLQVWQHHPQLAALRTRSRHALAEFAHCRGCDYIDWCTGSCAGIAYSITGEVDHPAPDACLRDYLAAGGRLPAADACLHTIMEEGS